MKMETNEYDVKSNNLPQYSVLMSVYSKDKAEWLRESIESMALQTHKPSEILVIEDGPVAEDLHEVIICCMRRFPGLIKNIQFSQNLGLAEAMHFGVKKCQYEWIARMDADDVSEKNRCEEELKKAIKVGADVVGCDCDEFIDCIDRPVSRRIFPEEHENLVRFSKRKVPFCHPAVIMKKSAVLKAGNYHNVYPHDDYDLFVRMFKTGAIGCTVKKTLFHVRVNEEFYKRRGGWKYVKTLINFNYQLLRNGWTTPFDFFIRSCGNVLFGLSPTCLRKFLYRRLLRK